MNVAAQKVRVAVVDYGMGNLFSIRNMVEAVGMEALVTAVPQEIAGADMVILPGVGAFGNAMETLRRLDLVTVLQDVAQSPKPLVGICLGLQLLMSESHEFGRHKGLDIIAGTVVRLDAGERHPVKVPQVGWNWIGRPSGTAHDPWQDTPLAGMADGTYMYFVHSYIVRPENRDVILTITRYGENEFCSGVRYKNIYAFQFHPERSGAAGLALYRNLASLVSIV